MPSYRPSSRFVIEPPEDVSTLPLATFPDDISLGQQRYMPMHLVRLFQSMTWARCQENTFLFYHHFSLWSRMFTGTPPGTLDNDWGVLMRAADFKACHPRHHQVLRESITHGLELVRSHPTETLPKGSRKAPERLLIEHRTLTDVSKPIIQMIDKTRDRQKKYEEKQRQKLNPDGKTTVGLPFYDGNTTVARRLEGKGIESYPPAPQELKAPAWMPRTDPNWPEWLRPNNEARGRMKAVAEAWCKAHLAAFSRAYNVIDADWRLLARWIVEDQHDVGDLIDLMPEAAESMAGRGFAPRSMAPLQADVDAEFIEVLEGCGGKRRFGRARDGRPGPLVPEDERPVQYRRVQPVDFSVKKRKTDQEIIAEAMEKMGMGEDLAEG